MLDFRLLMGSGFRAHNLLRGMRRRTNAGIPAALGLGYSDVREEYLQLQGTRMQYAYELKALYNPAWTMYQNRFRPES